MRHMPGSMLRKATPCDPEVRALAALLCDGKVEVRAFLSLHSYGNLWLVPYGYTSPPAYPPNYQVSLTPLLLTSNVSHRNFLREAS